MKQFKFKSTLVFNIISIVLIIASVLIYYKLSSSLKETKSNIYSDIKIKALETAKSASKYIALDKYEIVTDIQYNNFSNYLNSFESKSLQNVFLLKVKNNQFIVVADGTSNSQDRLYLNESFIPLSEKWDHVLEIKEGVFYDQSIDGLWLTYLYPILKNNNVIGILAIDVSMKSYLEVSNKFNDLDNDFYLFIILLIGSILVLFLFLLFDNQRKKEILEANRVQQDYLISETKHAQMGKAIDSVAHQWIQPLQAIRTITELWKLKKDRKIDIEDHLEKKDLDEILFNINFAFETLEEFRSFLSKDKEKESIEVSQIIKSSIKILDDILKHHHISVDLRSNTNRKINIYSNELKHVFINLIQNSKDAFIKNNILERTIDIVLEDYGDSGLKVSFIDNAGGISNDLVDNVFELYKTTKDSKNKTNNGLGLYMSKLILDKVNAEVSIENYLSGIKLVILFK